MEDVEYMNEYALTAKELEWLEKRKPYYVNNKMPNGYADPFIVWSNLEPDYQDAVEFEARVAQYIAEEVDYLYGMACTLQFLDGFAAKPQAWYILREARIVVEKEMDNESNHA